MLPNNKSWFGKGMFNQTCEVENTSRFDKNIWIAQDRCYGFWNINDLSLHCTDFFLERRNSFDYLHCLEEVDLQNEVKMRSEVVNL